MRYVREATLCVVSAEYKRKMTQQDLESVLSRLDLESSSWRNRIEQRIDEIAEKALADEAALRKDLAAVQSLCGPGIYIRNDSLKHESKVVHAAAVDGIGIPSYLWKTNCGWRFAAASFTRVSELPPRYTDICERCMPSARRSARALAGVLSDDE